MREVLGLEESGESAETAEAEAAEEAAVSEVAGSPATEESVR